MICVENLTKICQKFKDALFCFWKALPTDQMRKVAAVVACKLDEVDYLQDL